MVQEKPGLNAPSDAVETPVTFRSSDLELEGVLALPAGARRAVVICHPHPEYGGTMDDHVVVSVAGRLVRERIASLRFNFRGVGQSEGRYSGAFGETEDVRAAVELLAERSGVAHVALAGYSFGAMVASIVAAADPAVERLAAIALPATMFDTGCLVRCQKPKLFVHGDRDQYCPVRAVEELASTLPGPNRVRVLRGADHFLAGLGDEIGAEVAKFVAAGGQT